jgi:hypothetical protein
MAGIAVARTEALRVEKALLLKSEDDIRHGRERLRHQQELLQQLLARGRDTRQADRLVELMKATLVQWERHHVMIVERIAYLERVDRDC